MNRLLVLRCPKCNTASAAYVLHVSNTIDIGEAILRAEQDGRVVCFEESPVTLFAPCKCEMPRREGVTA